jgi:hypothetical protein
VESKQEVVDTKGDSEKLSILLSGDKVRKLNIPTTLPLSQVRKIVGKVEKVSPNLVELLHKGKLLTNNKAKLPDLDVKNGDTIVVRVTSKPDQRIKPKKQISTKPKVPLGNEKPAIVEITDDVKKPVPSGRPLSEEDLILETYPVQQRQIIQEIVKAGFPQESVIVALEITKFNKNYAMEWLLSDEIQMHKKIDSKQISLRDQLKVDHLPAVAKKSVAVKTEQKVIDEQKVDKKTWDCPTCTFTNLQIMPYCEMCGLKKKSKAPPKFSKKHKAEDLPVAVISNQEKDRVTEEKVIEAQSASKAMANLPLPPPAVHQKISSKNLVGSDRGNLKVTLIAAVGLMHKASYCLITLGRLTKKTKPVKKSKTLELDEVFFFNGFKPDSSRNLRVALMVEHKVRADRVIGQVSYALPLTFNSLSHDCIELTNQKNQTAGLLIISAVILQHGSND